MQEQHSVWRRHVGVCALAWVTGAALQLQQTALLPMPVAALLCGAGVLWAWSAARMAHTPHAHALWRWLGLPAVAVGLVLAALGWVGVLACTRADALATDLQGRDIDVVGVVQAMPQRQDVGWRFLFRVEHAQLPGQLQGQKVVLPRLLHVGWYSASARDADGTDAGLTESLQAGERWRMRLRVKAAHGHSNPGGFDHELWLWEQGIGATAYVRQGRHDPAPQRLEQTGLHPVEWLRQQVRDRLLARWPNAPAGGLLAAWVTGDQAAIDRSQWDVFRATGVAHLMSISGVHVTMLGWLVAHLGALLWRRSALWGFAGPLRWPAPTVGAVLGLCVAAAYAVFAGWGVPAQRTVGMMAVATLLRLSARDWHWRDVCAVVAAVVVTFDPWALLQPGFWLSFVAVAVLMSGETAPPDLAPAQPAQNSRLALHGLRKSAAGMRSLWQEQWRISLALMPLGALFFGQFSVAGLLANVVAIPWVTLLITPLALAGVVWSGFWDLAAWCLQPLLAMLHALAQWPWASVRLPMPPWPLAALALLGVALAQWRGPLAWRVWALPLVLPALLWQAPRPAHGHFELLAADVGQGNAVLVRTARHSLLYDTGPSYSPESDAGHRVLVPLLAHLGERLDVLMLSHPDTDHVGGARAVLAMQPQASVHASLPAAHALQQGRVVRACAAGQSWVWDGVRFEVLHPQPAADGGNVGAAPPNAAHSRSASNASSCVLRIASAVWPQAEHTEHTEHTAQGTALLAGDIEAAQERQLLAQGLAPVDMLLVPHHGSKTSSTPEFVQALAPRVALVQAGYRNRYGHPAALVQSRYEAQGVHLLTSARCGAMRWHSHSPHTWQCQRDEARRYWHHRPS